MNRRAWSLVALATVAGVACATSGTRAGDKGPLVCAGELCAQVVGKQGYHVVVVEVNAHAPAALHNAWIAESDGPPCRAGRALNAVQSDAGVVTNGPLPLTGTSRLTLSFSPKLTEGRALDLDVRSPGQTVCLRLPLHPTPGARDGGGG